MAIGLPQILCVTGLAYGATGWMNGDYTISNPQQGRSHPSHRGQFVDVYSWNISTHYSEVYWTMQPDVPLPADFVSQHDGRVVAFTGYEVDAVRLNAAGEEEHVPLYEQYNHHHNAYVMGKDATLVHMGSAGHHTMMGHPMAFENNFQPWDTATARSVNDIDGPQIPTTWFVVDGNGGEYRKSLHAVGTGYAHLVQSPVKFNVEPMMINTKNPYKKGPGGPLPRGKGGWKGARSPPNASYSGLLECPCTDRKTKVTTAHETRDKGSCPTQVAAATSCFQAAAALGLLPITQNVSVATGEAPPGCYVRGTHSGYEAYFNANSTSAVPCGRSDPTEPVRASGDVRSSDGVRVSLDLDGSQNCSKESNDLSGRWSWPGSARYPEPYDVSISKLNGQEGWYTISGGGSINSPCQKTNCTGRLNGTTFIMVSGFKLTAVLSSDWLTFQWTNGASWTRPRLCQGIATMTIEGPSSVWFGVGFGRNAMDGSYSVVVDGQGNVQERLLGNHMAGRVLADSVDVVNSSVLSGLRTVVLRRSMIGASSDHYSFDATSAGLQIITAVGNGTQLAYHKARTSTELALVPVNAPLCICLGHGGGSIDGFPFSHHCQPQPTSDLLVQKNPTCNVETYNGGLLCCKHKSILLDSDQELPAYLDTFRMKFRLYYEEYAQQRNTFFMFWTNEQGAGEFDIPQCLKVMSQEQCAQMGIVSGVHTTTSTFRVRDSMRKCNRLSDPWCAPNWNESSDVLLVRAGAHCHAPGCISAELWNDETGELLCRSKPIVGTGGGDFDDKDYANGITPCLWGEASDGLAPPPRLRLDTRLRNVHHKNATNFHYGVMAQWQMRGAFAPSEHSPQFLV